MSSRTWVSRRHTFAKDRRASGRHRFEQQRHVVAVSVATALVVATLSGWSPNSATAMAIAVGAVGIGLPHGALDIVIGPRLARPSTFFEMYLVVAASTLLVWLFAPTLGLVAFFAASWFHFARGDAAHHHDLGRVGALSGMSTAGFAIGLPLALHSGLVTPVLADLLLRTAAPTAGQVVVIGRLIAYPSIVMGIVAGIAALRSRRFAVVVELAAIALLSGVVHPLISFALYFALWHSPRHLSTIDIDRKTWTRTVGASAATLIIGSAVWRLTEPSPATAARWVFIGLAALTAPHLVVTELLRSRRSATAISTPAASHGQL